MMLAPRSERKLRRGLGWTFRVAAILPFAFSILYLTTVSKELNELLPIFPPHAEDTLVATRKDTSSATAKSMETMSKHPESVGNNGTPATVHMPPSDDHHVEESSKGIENEVLPTDGQQDDNDDRKDDGGAKDQNDDADDVEDDNGDGSHDKDDLDDGDARDNDGDDGDESSMGENDANDNAEIHTDKAESKKSRKKGDSSETTIFDKASLLPNPYRFWNTPRNPNWGIDTPNIHHVIRTYEDVDVPMDVLSSGGRSCVWDDDEENFQWICQDCETDENGESHCEWPLKPNFKDVQVWPRLAWDEPPRSSSSFDPLSLASAHSVVQTMYDDNKINGLQSVKCDFTTLEWPCFDLSKCRDDDTLSVYVVGNDMVLAVTGAVDYIDHADDSSTKSFLKRVDDPSEACLIAIGHTSYDTVEEMTGDSDVWMSGQNQFVWRSNRIFQSSGDFPIPNEFNWEFAVTATESSTDAHARLGMDTHVTFPILVRLYQDHGPPDPWEKRPILVNFKGVAYGRLPPFAHHRHLVAQFWPQDEKDVVADVYIEPGKEYFDIPEDEYAEVMMNTTFVFCPGGQALGSYRFGEALETGGIPVVLSAFVPPFAPEVDWSGCVVWVSEARLADLPSILRQFSRKEIAKRRRECWRLFMSVIWGYCPWLRDPRDCNNVNNQMFSVTMELWFHRIRRAKRRRQRRLDLRKSLVADGRKRHRP